MITKNTAAQIWSCHNEIEKSHGLIAEMKKQLEKNGDTLLPDSFGERIGLKLGVPTGSSGHQLYNVPPDLALKVIDAHIEQQKEKLKQLMTNAEIELRG